jgi:hypothetical protein
MRRALPLALFAISVVLTGCEKPTDIVFGPEPLKQMAEQGDRFRKLPEEERALLAAYLTLTEIGKSFGAEIKPASGRTVGEVLVEARAWQDKLKTAEAETKKRQAEESALKGKVLAERKAVADKIAESVTLAITDKKILPENYEAGRYSKMLVLHYAIENKSDKTIRQLKGQVIFFDATGDKVGDLPVDIDERIAPHKTLKTTTGLGWKLNSFSSSDVEKIARRDFNSMKAVFEAEAIAFDGGEVLRTSELK